MAEQRDKQIEYAWAILETSLDLLWRDDDNPKAEYRASRETIGFIWARARPCCLAIADIATMSRCDARHLYCRSV